MLTLDPFCSEALPLLPELRSAARRFAGPRRDVADDLVQETLLRAFAASSRYEPGTNARAWLHAILFNAARSNYRRERRDRRLMERYAQEPDARHCEAAEHQPAPARLGERLSRPLQQLLSGLPAAYRVVVELVDLEGQSYRDVATRLGVPVGTVMSRLHRGRRRLRSAIDLQPDAVASLGR